MMIENVISVSELNNKIKYQIDNNRDLKNLYVKGEIANLTIHNSGHIYFSLKDNLAKIDCMIWKTNASKFTALKISEGSEVKAVGKITFFNSYGKINFEVSDIELDGVGELKIIYDKRYKELESKGWFATDQKKKIPKFCTNIGVVTADTGAAIQDLISTIKRRMPSTNILLFPALVQGEKAAASIAIKIKFANKHYSNLDLLIVGRGGGSYEDLWSFNEMEVLEAIHISKIPIISAVGHEPDITLSDFVADVRAATPTAAGEIATTPTSNEIIDFICQKRIDWSKNITTKKNDIKFKLDSYKESNLNYLEKKVINVKNLLKTNFNEISFNIKNKINDFQREIDKLKKENLSGLEFKKYSLIKDLETIENRFELLNPTKPFEKGFALIKNKNNLIKSIDQVSLDDDINIILNDGILKTKVNSKEKK